MWKIEPQVNIFYNSDCNKCNTNFQKVIKFQTYIFNQLNKITKMYFDRYMLFTI